jgi:hypothetical protein
MTKLFSASFNSIVILLFACSALPVFAQHGGGGHGGGGGGGFHGGGGGGFHGGGGLHSGGGGGTRGGSYSGPAAGYRGSTAGAPSAPRSANSYYSRPGGNFAGGNQRYGNSAGSPAVADGQWHSFAGAAGSRGPSGASSVAGSPGNAGGFHVFSANRGTGSSGAVRSFSGQGGEVWENSSAPRNVVPKSQSLSTLHNSFRGSSGVNSGVRPNSTLSASSRFAGATTFTGNRGLSGGLNAANAFQARGSFRFGNRFNRFNRFGGGCWNCGFGFGFGGWGFGWPWLGFGFWNPFWFDPWWGAGPAYGYGYYAYPDSNVYGYPDSGYPAPEYNSNPPPPEQYQDQDNEESPNGNWVTPNGPSPSSAPNSANLTVPVLIYLKSGAVYTVRDYWMVDGELHFIQINGAQNSVDLQQVDLPRTNTENTKSGVKFIYKSEPSILAPEPPGASEPSPAPSPTQQLNAVPQPEAHT